MTLSPRTSLVALLTAGGILAVVATEQPPEPLVAATPSPSQDTDGDLLPDSLEWILMRDPLLADTDGDGRDDFLEVVTHELPLIGGSQPPAPLDHEMRAMVDLIELGGREHVVLHLMFRFATPNAWVTGLDTFLDVPHMGVKVPLQSIVGTGIYNVAMKTEAQEGNYLIVSSRLCTLDALQSVMPCAVGASATIGQRTFHTGTVILDVAGTAAALVPISSMSLALQPLDPLQGPGSEFWSQNRVCEMELVPVGQGGGVTVTQVVDAGCEGQASLRCAPDCSQLNGTVIAVPYGLGFLTGN